MQVRVGQARGCLGTARALQQDQQDQQGLAFHPSPRLQAYNTPKHARAGGSLVVGRMRMLPKTTLATAIASPTP